MNGVRRALPYVVLAFALASCHTPEHRESTRPETAEEAHLVDLEGSWAQAILDKDLSTLDEILARDFTLTLPTTAPMQSPQTRDAWLATVLNPTVHLDTVQVQAPHARIQGKIGVVQLRMLLGWKSETGPQEYEVLITDIWVERENQWKALARYTEQVTEGANPKPRG